MVEATNWTMFEFLKHFTLVDPHDVPPEDRFPFLSPEERVLDSLYVYCPPGRFKAPGFNPAGIEGYLFFTRRRLVFSRLWAKEPLWQVGLSEVRDVAPLERDRLFGAKKVRIHIRYQTAAGTEENERFGPMGSARGQGSRFDAWVVRVRDTLKEEGIALPPSPEQI
jgi:hypothetical protein